MDKKFALKLLKEIHSIPTAPYNEDGILKYVAAFARKRRIKTATDKHGNLLLHLDTGGKHPIGIVAHTDHPGFEISGDKNGRLVSRFHGGVPPSFFSGKTPVFFSANGKTVNASIVGYKTEIHPRSRKRRIKEVTLDGKSGLPVGAPGMWGKPFIKFKGDFIHAWAHDDVSGCALILCALNECIRRKYKVNIYALFTRAEETGFTGAIGFFDELKRHKLIPKNIPLISIETSKELPGARRGRGIVIRIGDRMTTFDPKLVNFMETIGKELKKADKEFRYQRRLMDGGTCEATVFALWGFQTAGLAMPLGNYHNVNRKDKDISPEIIHKRDFFSGALLFAEMARRIGEMEKIWREVKKRLLDISASGRRRLVTGKW
ncbi:MAG: hypothetical protein Kow0090_20960 [Myxococcota bacterium]